MASVRFDQGEGREEGREADKKMKQEKEEKEEKKRRTEEQEAEDEEEKDPLRHLSKHSRISWGLHTNV